MLHEDQPAIQARHATRLPGQFAAAGIIETLHGVYVKIAVEAVRREREVFRHGLLEIDGCVVAPGRGPPRAAAPRCTPTTSSTRRIEQRQVRPEPTPISRTWPFAFAMKRRCLDIALDLIGYDSLEERRSDAESRGKRFGIGIGSTLDSGTNNFGQSMILNPELQFSGNNEVATVKLDIFGEVVVTLGTVPQGQGHETTSAQVVAEILGCTPDDVNVRAGHDTYWNSTAGFSGTYASQFAVTGLGAVKGATEKLAGEMKQLAAAVFGCSPDDIELVESQARIKGNPEAALPFMALGAILNANNAGLPPELDITLNVRHVYRPYFEKPDLERKFGNLTLTYATQIHACAVEIDPETGVYEIVDYAAVDDCGNRIHPQIVEGQVHGATAQALGAATHEIFTYDEEGNLLTPNFYDYHVPHALDMPPMKTGFIESESPFTPLGAKGMGEGGGAGIHAVCAALQNALGSRGEGPIVWRSCNPYEGVWDLLQKPEDTRKLVSVESR